MEKKATPAKTIRFYGIEKPREMMDEITIEDLQEAGFVFYRYRTDKDPVTLKFNSTIDPIRLVHNSVPVHESTYSSEADDYQYPIIRYEVGYGWEAKWGAVRSQVGTHKLLRAFMERFNYPLPTLEDGTTNQGTN